MYAALERGPPGSALSWKIPETTGVYARDFSTFRRSLRSEWFNGQDRDHKLGQEMQVN
jgi:hypothetical protein